MKDLNEFRYVRMKTLHDHNMQLMQENKSLRDERDKLLQTLFKIESRCATLVNRINKSLAQDNDETL